MNRIQFIRNLIAQHRSIGIVPTEMHMNGATADDFSREFSENTPDTRSVLDKLLNEKPKSARLESFEGVKIVANEGISGSCIILRPIQAMGDPDWLQHIHYGPQEAAQADQRSFRKKQVESEPADLQKHDDVLAQLTQNAGISPSTVLIKAMEDLDKVEDVIVLRFFKGGSIDLCSTYNKYAVIGALQASFGYVVNRDGE